MGYFNIWRKIADHGVNGPGVLCDKWRHYRGWLEDVTQLPGASPEATFRRLDANRLYESGNVQWVPKRGRGRLPGQPPAPRSNQVFHLTHNGQPITQVQAAAILNTTPGALRQKLLNRWHKPERFLKEKGNHFDLNEFLWT